MLLLNLFNKDWLFIADTSLQMKNKAKSGTKRKQYRKSQRSSLNSSQGSLSKTCYESGILQKLLKIFILNI